MSQEKEAFGLANDIQIEFDLPIWTVPDLEAMIKPYLVEAQKDGEDEMAITILKCSGSPTLYALAESYRERNKK